MCKFRAAIGPRRYTNTALLDEIGYFIGKPTASNPNSMLNRPPYAKSSMGINTNGEKDY